MLAPKTIPVLFPDMIEEVEDDGIRIGSTYVDNRVNLGGRTLQTTDGTGSSAPSMHFFWSLLATIMVRLWL